MSFYDSASLAFLPSGGAGKDGKAYSIKPVPEYGNELVTNGGFDTDSYWTKETGWSIANGKATQDGSAVGAGGAGDLVSGGTIFQIGKTYLIKIDIVDYVSGDLDVTSSNIPLSANKDGSYYTYYTAATAYLHIRAGYSSFIGSVDNVSVKEVIVDGDFTFSRGINLTATRVDSNGLIEKGRENLFTNSDMTSGVTLDQITRTTGQADPFGGTDAIKITETTATGNHRWYKLSITPTGVFTASVYMKYDGRKIIRIHIDNGNFLAGFDILNGTVYSTQSSVIDAKIEAVGTDGWYRCSVTANGTAAGWIGIYMLSDSGANSYTGDGSSVFLFGFQLELGLVATDYIESGATTGKAGILEDSPRFDYSGGASCPSLLLEPSRTNLITHSEYFDSWTKISSPTTTTNYGISPEGVQNSTRFQTSVGRLTTSITTINANETFSVYMKGSGTMRIQVGNDNFFPSVTSEWVRYEFTTTQVGSNANVQIRGNGSAVDVELYGAQYERNTYATSYIPNHSGGSVTRNADYFKVINQEGLFGTNEGTFFMEFAFDVNNKYIGIGDTWPSDKVTIGLNASGTNQIRSLIINDGVGINLQGSGTTLGETIKACVSYGSNGFKLFMNGSLEDSDSTAARLAQFSDLIPNVDVRDVGGANSGTIKQILLFPTALSNTDCEILTGTSYESFTAMATALNYTTYE